MKCPPPVTNGTTCPACGRALAVWGCVTGDAGTFCKAPGAPRPHLRLTARGIAIVTHDPKKKEGLPK